MAARDEEVMLPGCLSRLAFADEVIVIVDDRTQDSTGAIASDSGATVGRITFRSFSQMKNAGIEMASGDWVLVVDADERVTTPLAQEVSTVIRSRRHAAYQIPIQNWFYGRRLTHGGYRERPIRLFRRSSGRYEGDIHETLILSPGATVGCVSEPLVHFSHRSVLDNLEKTRTYAAVQAAELARQGHPLVTPWTLMRVLAVHLARHLVIGRGFRDGTEGWIEGLYQPLSHFVVHAHLWELQQDPPLPDRYEQAEKLLP